MAMAVDYVFTGTAPALVTPFTEDNKVDLEAFRELVRWQIEGGVDALVVLGTTGENPTINHDERRALVDAALEEANNEVPVIVGTGTNNTRQSITFSKEAETAGADGLLVVGPYYNKPTQDGFRQHVAAIADASDCPIIVYNVPGRTSFNITAQTMLQIAEEIPTVVGSKEASGNIAQISDILAYRPDHLAVYAGDDEMAFPLISLGADGVISVISNVLPQVFSDFIQDAMDGNANEARSGHFSLLQAMRACFVGTNPLPVKYLLAKQQRMEAKARLPLGELSEGQKREIEEAFEPHPA